MIRQVMMQSRKTGEFLQLYQKLAEAGLTPLVVKGLICRSLYREPDYRASGDEDILIPAEQFPECSRIFAENLMLPAEPDKDPEKEGEVPYYKAGGALHIELHKELFSSESDAYGSLNDFSETPLCGRSRKRYRESRSIHFATRIIFCILSCMHSNISFTADSGSVRYVISSFMRVYMEKR